MLMRPVSSDESACWSPRPSTPPSSWRRRHPHVVEHHLAGLGALVAELAHVLGDLEPGRARVDEQHAHAAVGRLRPRIGLHEHRQRVGVAGVGDPHLGAADDVVVTVAPRRGRDALQVGARARLGERDRGAPLPRRELRQVALLLLLGAVAGDHPAGHRVAAEDAGDAHPAARDLLEGQRERHGVRLEPAVGLGHGEPEEPEPAHALDDLGRVAALVLPVARDRHDLAVDERAQGVAEEPLLVAQPEVHQRSSPNPMSWVPNAPASRSAARRSSS